MPIHKRKTLIAIASAVMMTTLSPISAAATTPEGVDPEKGCVYNGQRIEFENNIAPGPACYTTPDILDNPRLAEVDNRKNEKELDTVRKWSPLAPEHYVARDTMANAPLPDNAPIVENSQEISDSIGNIVDKYVADQFKGSLRTGANVGNGVHANDNIPIYTVDSSNKHQQYAEFSSTDNRVVNFGGIMFYNTGQVPIPNNFKPSDGGDRAAAIYDVGTGIYREYFGLKKKEGIIANLLGEWQFSSAGYWQGDKENLTAGDNYSLGLTQGTSSVVGLSNSLTQIGIDEVKAGRINHVISVTFPNYLPGISYPAKGSDGTLLPSEFPNAPIAGQRFRIAPDFDIDAWAKKVNADPINIMIMRALQEYGGIITDKNHWSTAINFENPYGMGEEGNPWRDDPEAWALMSRYRSNLLPWNEVQWIVPNYAPMIIASELADAPEPTPTTDPTPTASPTPTGNPSPTPVPTSDPTPTVTPEEPTPTITPTPTSEPAPSPSAIPTPTPSETATQPAPSQTGAPNPTHSASPSSNVSNPSSPKPSVSSSSAQEVESPTMRPSSTPSRSNTSSSTSEPLKAENAPSETPQGDSEAIGESKATSTQDHHKESSDRNTAVHKEESDSNRSERSSSASPSASSTDKEDSNTMEIRTGNTGNNDSTPEIALATGAVLMIISVFYTLLNRKRKTSMK